MDFTQYKDVVHEWIDQIIKNRITDVELTLTY